MSRIFNARSWILPAAFLISLAVSGCGHVAGNYPALPRQKSALPEKFKSPKGKETTLTWVEEGQVHGFLNLWRDTSVRAEAFKKLAAQSGLDVHREGVTMFSELSAAGIAEITLFVFFDPKTSISCNTGDFEIRFTDGTTVRDVGVLRYEPRDTAKPYRYTRDGSITLSSEPVGKKEPLPVILFVPAEHLEKKVASISRGK